MSAATDRRRFKRPESVLVLVAAASGEVLMLERRRPPGFWQSVTGSLDRGEAPPEAAVRELHEETGLEAGDRLEDCRVSRRFEILPEWRERFAPGVATNLEHVFRLILPEPVAVRLDPDEHVDYEWLPPAVAVKRTPSWTNRKAIEECLPR